MNISVFGKRLKELRGKESQSDCATRILKKTGVSLTAQTLGRYEKGTRKPDIEIIEALAKTFDVSADYLLGLTDTKSPCIKVQAVCEYTGLSEKAIKNIRSFPFCEMYSSDLSNYLESVDLIDFISTFQDFISEYAEMEKNIEEAEQNEEIKDRYDYLIWKMEKSIKSFVESEISKAK